MKYSLFAFSILTGAAHARPSADFQPRDDVQTAHFVFHGGPASYQLNVTANGAKVPTNSDISINIIDAPDYNALQQCTFETDGEKTLVLSIDRQDGSQHVIVGPPQPIRRVSCEGMCVPTYGECYGSDGQYVGPCCNGFCAATRCRPWNTGVN